MTSRLARFAAAVAVVSLVAFPMFAARGSADFTRYVALGDSFGAGYVAGSLNQNHQPYGWPAVIARQVGLKICAPTASATDNCFAIPLISNPGLPNGELMFTGTGVAVLAPGAGSPIMAGFGRPYNNLSVPGYTVGAALTLTGAEPTSGLGQAILRGLGTEVTQAVALHPTFVAVWLGGNDFLGAVSAGDPSKLTPVASFTTQYNALLDALVAGAPNAGMVVGTLPANFASAPLTARLPAVVFDGSFQPVSIPGVGTLPLIYLPTGATTPVAVPTGSVVVLSALSRYQQGYGLPPALKGVPPFSSLPHTGEPLSDAEVITPTELATFTSTITSYNTAITAAAQRLNIPVADIKGLFDRWVTPQVFGGITLTNSFITGGLFSNDGAHLTDIGYTLFANEFIKAINSGYGTKIPLASLTQFFQNNGAEIGFKPASMPSVSTEAARAMTSIFSSVTTTPAPTRRRASGH